MITKWWGNVIVIVKGNVNIVDYSQQKKNNKVTDKHHLVGFESP